MTRVRTMLLPLSIALNVVLAAVVVLLLVRARGARREIPIEASGWLHQPAQEVFAQMPSEPGCRVFLGDSLTAEGPWGELAGGLLNRGVKGDTVEGVRRRLGEVLARSPSRVFLMIGINDLMQGRSEAEIVAGVDAIAAECSARSPGTRLVLLSLLPVGAGAPDPFLTNGRLRALNASLAEVAGRRGAAFVDLFPRFADAQGGLRPELTRDGVHLTPKGYLLWRDGIAAELR